MNIVEKEIKKTVTLYETFDGKDFEERGDAIWHEYDTLIELEELKVMNEFGNKADLSGCEVVYIETQRALEVFIAINEYEGYYYNGLDGEISELGWYFWENEEWISPQKKLNIYKDEINEILVKCGGVPIE
jgi:hypothetical protein